MSEARQALEAESESLTNALWHAALQLESVMNRIRQNKQALARLAPQRAAPAKEPVPESARAKHDRERFLAKVAPEILQGEDGFFGYWPDGPKGYLTAYNLRWIADELDRRNEPWQKQIEIDLAPPANLEPHRQGGERGADKVSGAVPGLHGGESRFTGSTAPPFAPPAKEPVPRKWVDDSDPYAAMAEVMEGTAPPAPEQGQPQGAAEVPVELAIAWRDSQIAAAREQGRNVAVKCEWRAAEQTQYPGDCGETVRITVYRCPVCFNEKSEGHKPDCELAALLAASKGGDQ